VLPLLELSPLADTQAEEEKNGKSDLRNLNTVYVFIFFPRVTALQASSESDTCPSASQPLGQASPLCPEGRPCLAFQWCSTPQS